MSGSSGNDKSNGKSNGLNKLLAWASGLLATGICALVLIIINNGSRLSVLETEAHHDTQQIAALQAQVTELRKGGSDQIRVVQNDLEADSKRLDGVESRLSSVRDNQIEMRTGLEGLRAAVAALSHRIDPYTPGR